MMLMVLIRQNYYWLRKSNMATKTFEIDWIDLKGYEGLYKISTDG
mgnify:CR=1 FL=1